MKKRIICAVLSSVMILSFVGCTNSIETQETTKETVSVSTQEKTKEAEAKTLKEVTEQELLETAVSNNMGIQIHELDEFQIEQGVMRTISIGKANSTGSKAYMMDYGYFADNSMAVYNYNTWIYSAVSPYYESTIEDYTYLYNNTNGYTMTNEQGDNYLHHSCQTPDGYIELYCIDNTLIALTVYDDTMKDEATDILHSLIK